MKNRNKDKTENIEIPRNVNKRCFNIALVSEGIYKCNKNYSKQLLNKEYSENEIRNELRKEGFELKQEVWDKISQYSEKEIEQYIQTIKTEQHVNNFIQTITENEDIFIEKFLEVEKTSYYKNTCKALLRQSIVMYKTKYDDEIYIKTDKTHYQNIGNTYTDVYNYYYALYKETYTDLQRYIPFSEFFNTHLIKERTFENLEPNRHIILFNDCLLDLENAHTYSYEKITKDNIPFCVIDANYKEKKQCYYNFIIDLIKKLVEEPDVLKSILYSLLNKDELIKSAIFNIQRSGAGKTVLLEPFKALGLLKTVEADILNKTLEKEAMFKQKLIINFEEIQNTQIQGSNFNSLIDRSSISISRKNKTAIEIPSYLKPAIIINGEGLPDFRGRTKGTLNRFSKVPDFIRNISPEDAEFIEEHATEIGIELIRYLLMFKNSTSKEKRQKLLKTCKITEKDYISMKETKTEIIFKYIKDNPDIALNNTIYCISQNMLIELIFYLQQKDIITVDLFNEETEVKKFIKENIVKNLEVDTSIDILSAVSIKKVYKNGTGKTMRLKNCYQLTEEGKKIFTEIGYKLDNLLYYETA